jgi:hypothetical protein
LSVFEYDRRWDQANSTYFHGRGDEPLSDAATEAFLECSLSVRLQSVTFELSIGTNTFPPLG